MTNQAALIPTSGPHTHVTPANGEFFTLEEAQGIVDGYVEVVKLVGDNFMLVDEDAMLKQKPANDFAAILAHTPIAGVALVGDRKIMKGVLE